MNSTVQEYPKALYANGKLKGHAVVVFGADEEAMKREEGYKSLGEKAPKSASADQEEAPAENEQEPDQEEAQAE